MLVGCNVTGLHALESVVLGHRAEHDVKAHWAIYVNNEKLAKCGEYKYHTHTHFVVTL